MIHITPQNKDTLKNVSLKLSTPTMQLIDIIREGANNIIEKNYIDNSISKPDIYREMIDESFKKDINVLQIAEKQYSIKDILKEQVGDFENISNILDIFDNDDEKIKIWLLEKSEYISDYMLDDIQEIDIEEEDLDEEEKEELQEQIKDIQNISGSGREEGFDECYDSALTKISVMQELIGDYNLAIETFFERLESEVFECKEFLRIMPLYYYKPSVYNKCLNEFRVLIDRWDDFCRMYTLKYKDIWQMTYRRFYKEFKEDII